MTGRALGIDACKRGWIGILLDGTVVVAHFAPTIADLVAAADSDGTVDVIGVDIPIGLADTGARQADRLAARELGPRRSSLFHTPVRAAVYADSYAQARTRNAERGGPGISAQAYGLFAKIREVDAWVPAQRRRIVEVHPELSFRVMLGRHVPYPKRTWAGTELRRGLLADAGIELAADLGTAGTAGVDDVLDAAAAAWSARRVLAGYATSRPDPPEVFGDGIPCAIWV